MTADPQEMHHGPVHEIVIELGRLKPQLLRGARMFVETVTVPTALLFVLLHTAGLVWGLVAVIGWCALTLGVRRLFGQHLPGTLLLCAGMLCGRAALALVLSSALVYVLQPVFGSVLMALLFLGSAAVGRPVTIRLARDFVSLPAQLFHHQGVRRMFTQVAIVWGISRRDRRRDEPGPAALRRRLRPALAWPVQRAADRADHRGLRRLGGPRAAPDAGRDVAAGEHRLNVNG